MGTVNKLAERVQNSLEEIFPQLRQTVTRKLSLAVGAMLEGQTPNPVELSKLLPLQPKRPDMREQWLRRLLKNSLLNGTVGMKPFATRELSKAGPNRQPILLCLAQSDLGNRIALLIISLRVGGRALPLAW
ncbi:transposase [Thioploca ingrica]|uniref:Transposase n=1 Tax=Thioploca ingrica TaxID=40754 RepID=A0A090APN1_9GAMM|nr:transposase [Thioploca ingrica]